MNPIIRFTPPHASRSFGLKRDFLSLHHSLTRQSTSGVGDLLPFFSEVALVALTTGDQFGENSLWTTHFIANSNDYNVPSTLYDPAILDDNIDVRLDMGYMEM